MNFDDDALVACADLVGRTGAKHFQIGYLHDDVSAEDAGWYAHAQYKGARITEENHRGPVEAAEALARRLLTSARCRCGKLAALSDAGAMVYGGAHLVDGSTWNAEDARRAGQCRWTRVGSRWEMGCGQSAPNRPSDAAGGRSR